MKQSTRLNLLSIAVLSSASFSSALFVTAVHANTDLEQAKLISQKTGRPILAVAGSKT